MYTYVRTPRMISVSITIIIITALLVDTFFLAWAADVRCVSILCLDALKTALRVFCDKVFSCDFPCVHLRYFRYGSSQNNDSRDSRIIYKLKSRRFINYYLH